MPSTAVNGFAINRCLNTLISYRRKTIYRFGN